MGLKLRVLPLLTIIVSLICLTFLSYRGYQWWEKHQKRKALFRCRGFELGRALVANIEGHMLSSLVLLEH